MELYIENYILIVISCIRFLVELIILNLLDFVNTNKRNFLFFVVSYIFYKFFLLILRSDFLSLGLSKNNYEEYIDFLLFMSYSLNCKPFLL